MTFKQNIERWTRNILYKRVRRSHGNILDNQIRKGAEKYRDPLPGDWTAKQLIRHGKEENVDQFVYYEALEMVVESMEGELEYLRKEVAQLKRSLADAQVAENKAKQALADQIRAGERERRKWANFGR